VTCLQGRESEELRAKPGTYAGPEGPVVVPATLGPRQGWIFRLWKLLPIPPSLTIYSVEITWSGLVRYELRGGVTSSTVGLRFDPEAPTGMYAYALTSRTGGDMKNVRR